MMIASLLNHPLGAMAIFFALSGMLYWFGRRWSAQGMESEGKHTPYACGEDFGPEETQLSYKRFFRLALMFVVVHMATLVVAMLPMALDARLVATLYLLGVALCVDTLVKGED